MCPELGQLTWAFGTRKSSDLFIAALAALLHRSTGATGGRMSSSTTSRQRSEAGARTHPDEQPRPKLRKEAYAFFGANGDPVGLRRLQAFRRVEEQIEAAIRIAAPDR
ncbi:hypothetical protein [Sorangium sp. So ce1078]|uniref:hypothetical protein n=1 Tax=Sorangium sp. So ce1078 TaxID=3133329 RepID=UPI003F6147DB